MRISDRESRDPGAWGTDLEFEARLSSEGVLEFPPELSEQLRALRGSRLRVRLRTQETAAGLQARRVSDEEISAIASLQSEEREAVVRFLLSEGALRRAGRRASR